MAKRKLCVSEETLNKLKSVFKDDSEVLEELGKLSTCKVRKLSAYQQFASECLKGGGTIKDCAAKWREMKGK